MKGNLVLTGGEFRSRRLIAPEGRDTRPTRAMVREALFNMLHGQTEGARVLDLFAGSGALGFEALSRGARAVTFCDHARDAMDAVRRNAAALNAGDRCAFLQMDWRGALERLDRDGGRFDLVLLDPPYGMDPVPVLAEIKARGILCRNGLAVLEHSSREEPALPPGFQTARCRRYGESAVILMTLATEESE